MEAASLAESTVPLPEPPVVPEMSAAQKAAKDKLENPTVDANGEHIQTVEEAKMEAMAMQQALDMGVQAVDTKI